jgi:MFS family permease
MDTATRWPSPAQAWLTTGAMTVAYAISYLDRQLINLLAPALKADLALTDVELSVLQGTAFAIPFVTFGLVAGALADRFGRVRLVAAGMAAWSAMTSLCGVVRHFGGLFACRAGVGVGEAVLTPAAVSMISDQFPPTQRPRALATYQMGSTVGAALGYVLIGAWLPHEPVHVAGLGVLQPWQATFLALGVPGVLCAALLLALQEPARRGLMRPADAPAAGYGDALRFLWARRAAFAPTMIGFGLLGLLAYGPASQTTLFFVRTYGWTIGEIASVNGLLIVLTGTPGALFGGHLAVRLRRRHPDGTLRAIAYATTAAIVPITFLWLSPTPLLAWIGQGAMNFAVAASINLNTAALADVTPNELRGKTIALNAMLITLVGLGVGPTLIAMITDYVLHDESQLRWSLVMFSAVVSPLAALVLWRALPAYRRVALEAEQWTHDAPGVQAR